MVHLKEFNFVENFFVIPLTNLSLWIKNCVFLDESTNLKNLILHIMSYRHVTVHL